VMSKSRLLIVSFIIGTLMMLAFQHSHRPALLSKRRPRANRPRPRRHRGLTRLERLQEPPPTFRSKNPASLH